MKDEEGSRFQGGVVMHARYLLMQLIGKGGFSEVFQASGGSAWGVHLLFASPTCVELS